MIDFTNPEETFKTALSIACHNTGIDETLKLLCKTEMKSTLRKYQEFAVAIGKGLELDDLGDDGEYIKEQWEELNARLKELIKTKKAYKLVDSPEEISVTDLRLLSIQQYIRMAVRKVNHYQELRRQLIILTGAF